jgi:hypothetical protein
VLLNEWTWDFPVPTPLWIDIVEPAVPGADNRLVTCSAAGRRLNI